MHFLIGIDLEKQPEAVVSTLERDQLLAVLRSAGSREAAAEQLGISRSTLWRRMKQLGLMGEHGREPAP